MCCALILGTREHFTRLLKLYGVLNYKAVEASPSRRLDLVRFLTVDSVQAEALTKAQQELGEVTGELGLAFVKIAKFEEEPGETFCGPSICFFCH
jgi:hypothetical protein